MNFHEGQSVCRILVQKRPPDVPAGTNPQIVALIRRCAACSQISKKTNLQTEIDQLTVYE